MSCTRKSKCPAAMLNVHLAHAVTKTASNLTVYYAPQMVDIVKNFSQVHDISQIILLSVILTLLTRTWIRTRD